MAEIMVVSRVGTPAQEIARIRVPKADAEKKAQELRWQNIPGRLVFVSRSRRGL